MKRLLPVVIACTGLFGCSDSLEDQQKALEKFTKDNRVGDGADVWLVKHNMLGEFEKVSLVFGFIDDFEFCQEVAAMYNRRYPNADLSCQLAN